MGECLGLLAIRHMRHARHWQPLSMGKVPDWQPLVQFHRSHSGMGKEHARARLGLMALSSFLKFQCPSG